ncbi:hypothetical protein [Nonomuraea wenchangensis]|uniref:Uncharacterized protein n=1 Tax=Nonomuraea wenchangensis TaxID=568860 RepID=A0A1I0F434_9ACTN|nr:hypothetical protein [Nonomuraea wenchangensis]SET52404.1 hypothetical protein SAMN05421811_103306 [Nonomuraea wenchangensis]
MSYTFMGPHNYNLTIDKSDIYGEAAEVGVGGRVVDVPAADLPEIVAALYRAAGQEPPIILPRPDTHELRTEGWVDGRNVNASAGLRVVGSVPTMQARDYAAHLAAAADLADAEPDPEQLKQLVELIDPWSTAEANARAILAAGYGRTEEQA